MGEIEMIEGKKIFNNRNIILTSLFILIFLSISLILTFLPKGTTITDDDILYYSSIHYISNNNLQVQLPLNKEYDTCLFSSILYSTNKEKETYFGVIPTSTMFYSYFMVNLHEKALFYLNLIFVPLIIIFIFLLVNEMTSSKLCAILTTTSITTFVIFLRIYIGIWDIIPTVLFLILSLFYLMTNRSILLSSIFFVLALSLRYSEVIYIIPILFLFILNKKIELKRKLIFFIPILIFIISIFIFNYHFFGDPYFIAKGNTNEYACMDNPKSIDYGSYFGFLHNWRMVITHLIYFFKYHFFFMPLFIFSIAGIIFSWFKKPKFTIFTLISILIATTFYGQGIVYFGFLEYNLQSSYMRYLLFGSMLLIIATSFFFLDMYYRSLSNYKKTKVIFTALIITSLFLNIYSVYNYSPNGIREYIEIRNSVVNDRVLFEQTFDEEDIFITQEFTHKYLSPKYNNMVPLTNKYHMDDPLIAKQINGDFLELIEMLNSDNKEIYLLYNPYRDQSYIKEILEEYNLTRVFNSSSVEVYKLSVN